MVFRVRCSMHKSIIDDILAFFDANDYRRAWAWHSFFVGADYT